MKTVENWNTGWRFAKCPSGTPDAALPIAGDAVTLPHTWYADGDYYQGDAVYQKAFTLTPQAGQKIFARFNAVDKVCEVYLNGKHIGGHKGGYTRFAVELTGALQPGENLLTVFVNNESGQTVSPLMGDFATFGGIYRDAELVTVGANHFDLLYYGTDGVLFRTAVNADGAGTLTAEAHVCGAGAVQITLADAEGRIVAQGGQSLTIPAPQLWNGKDAPYLYTAAATLTVDGAEADAVRLPVGFRSVAVDADKGFFLNGLHLKLRGVAKHQDTAGVYCAAGPEHWAQDIALIEEIGANAVRLSHYPHPQAVYDLCDQKGFVVWAEIPMLMLNETDALMENAKQQLTEMILQNLHHPCICFWGVQNEVGLMGEKPFMAGKVRELRDHAHTLDKSRPTTSANCSAVEIDSGLNRITDVTAYNIYYGWYYGVMADHAKFLDDFHAAHPAMPLGISEYGVDTNIAYHSGAPRVNDYTEEYQALYHETVYPYMAQRDFVWGSFVWNMFEFVSPIRTAANIRFRNLKGLVTHDRTTRKDAFYYYKAVWSDVPFVHIAQKRYANRAAEAMTVKVYTNQPQVTLTAAGGTYTAPVQNGSAVFENIPLAMGENAVKAAAGGCADSAVFTRVETPDASYVYVDNDPGLNVRDWFMDAEEEARLFPQDAYSLRDKVEVLAANAGVMAVADRMLPKIADLLREAPGKFTLERVIQHERPDCSEEDIKALNLAFTQIRKES